MTNKVIKTIRNPRLLKLFKLYAFGAMRQSQTTKAYNKGIVDLPYPPIKVRIESTNRCNLHCIMCPTGCSDNRSDTGFMDFGLYEKIVDEARNFPYPTWLILYLGGEPLLHKDLVRMIKLAKSKRLYCRFSTNATLLTMYKTDELLKSGLDCIDLSFDDVSPNEYQLMRRGASYFKTYYNIIHFLEQKKHFDLLHPLVTIDSLRLREDGMYKGGKVAPSKEFRRLFAGYDVQNIAVMWAHLWAGEFAEKPPYTYTRKENGYTGKCILPWTDLTMNWKGQVVACCYDLKYDYVIGDVNKNSLLEVWNSDRMVELRKKLLAGEYADLTLCRSCSLALGEF